MSAATTTEKDDYKWPENLYLELRDMSAMSFLMYTISYVVDTARKHPDDFVGFEQHEETHRWHKCKTREVTSDRSFAPQDLLDAIEKNRDVLKKEYPAEFGDGPAFDMLMQNLKVLQERCDSCKTSDRPLTLEDFDDRHQKHELVYAITKDEINKRITLAFRGTTNSLAMASNWSANLNFPKEFGTMPDSLKPLIPKIRHLRFHQGFYNYVFGKTKGEDDSEEFRKYDEILDDVKEQLKKNPGYKLYVTGHSLGAALSTLVAFYLSCEPDDDIPKPVVNANFASPRLGCDEVFEATAALRKAGKLYVLRVTNENDAICVLPWLGYEHLGMQLRLYRGDSDPELDIARESDRFFGRMYRAFNNSIIANLNVRYDHGDYRTRVDKHQEWISKQPNVIGLFKDE